MKDYLDELIDWVKAKEKFFNLNWKPKRDMIYKPKEEEPEDFLTKEDMRL